MAQGMTYKDFEARMAAARAAHLKNIDITGKKIQGIYTQAARDLAKRAEATRAGTLTERWVKDYQKALEKRSCAASWAARSSLACESRQGFRVIQWKGGSMTRWRWSAWTGALPAHFPERRTRRCGC